MTTALPELSKSKYPQVACARSSSVSGFTTPSATEVVHPDLARLLRNRQETESARQGWYSLQRARKSHRPAYVKNFPDHALKSWSEASITRGPESIASEKYYTALTYPRAKPNGKNKRSKRDRELSTPKYYTAMTIRPPKSTASPRFNALNRGFYGSIPDWFDRPKSGEFPTKSMDFWYNEVNKKPALNRPPPFVYLPHPTPNPDLEKLRYRPPKNTTMFYASNPPVPNKHYMVCPEWPSEKLNRPQYDR
ncbi:uncharacterized protein LOC141905365 [Tubulanus polymorphus]|uniref:uncharacterized protein LOC141905365 n=1 Tax=Tubulanus polymorphus TaxID=672921 RepID=UPI003DA2B914